MSKLLTFTLRAALLRHQTTLDALLHPLRGAVRTQARDSALAVVQLALLGSVKLLFFLLVNHSIIAEVSVALSDPGLSFSVVTVNAVNIGHTKVEEMSSLSLERVTTCLASSVCLVILGAAGVRTPSPGIRAYTHLIEPTVQLDLHSQPTDNFILVGLLCLVRQGVLPQLLQILADHDRDSHIGLFIVHQILQPQDCESIGRTTYNPASAKLENARRSVPAVHR